VISNNYPNPFNSNTYFNYRLINKSLVTIKILNELGQLIKLITNKEMQPGSYICDWNTLDMEDNFVPSGIYILEIEIGNQKKSRKMILIR